MAASGGSFPANPQALSRIERVGVLSLPAPNPSGRPAATTVGAKPDSEQRKTQRHRAASAKDGSHMTLHKSSTPRPASQTRATRRSNKLKDSLRDIYHLSRGSKRSATATSHQHHSSDEMIPRGDGRSVPRQRQTKMPSLAAHRTRHARRSDSDLPRSVPNFTGPGPWQDNSNVGSITNSTAESLGPALVDQQPRLGKDNVMKEGGSGDQQPLTWVRPHDQAPDKNTNNGTDGATFDTPSCHFDEQPRSVSPYRGADSGQQPQQLPRLLFAQPWPARRNSMTMQQHRQSEVYRNYDSINDIVRTGNLPTNSQPANMHFGVPAAYDYVKASQATRPATPHASSASIIGGGDDTSSINNSSGHRKHVPAGVGAASAVSPDRISLEDVPRGAGAGDQQQQLSMLQSELQNTRKERDAARAEVKQLEKRLARRDRKANAASNTIQQEVERPLPTPPPPPPSLPAQPQESVPVHQGQPQIYNFLTEQDSAIARSLEDLEKSVNGWVNDVHSEMVPEDLSLEEMAPVVRGEESVVRGRLHSTDAKAAARASKMLLTALLNHHLCARILDRPFFFFHKAQQEALQSTYNAMLQKNQEAANHYRCLIIRTYERNGSPPSGTFAAGGANDAASPMVNEACDVLMQGFLTGPAGRILRQRAEKDGIEARLKVIFLKTANISVRVHSQLREWHFGTQETLLQTKFEIASPMMRAHNVHRLSDDDTRMDGTSVFMVLSPNVWVFGSSFGEDYHERCDISRAVVWLEGG